MRTAARVDANHAQIVQAFRAMGCSVLSLAQVGKGCPDLVIGTHGINLLVEVKTPKGKLTNDQSAFIAGWKGGYDVVRTTEDVANLLQTVRKLAR